MIVRAGLIVSAACHGGLALAVLLLLAGPKPFASVPEQAIIVEVVTPQEIAAAAPARPQSVVNSEAPQQIAEPPRPEAAGAFGPAPAPSPAPPQPAFSMLDPAGMALFNMRLPEPGFDAPADAAAQLARDEIAAFKSHLRKCWRSPAQVDASSKTRVVIRMFLARSGALASEPMLIEASAAQDGPFVMQAAIAAIHRCQPFTMLPRDRYGEWKVLDVTFSPREMFGG
jgi:hypothetical protein